MHTTWLLGRNVCVAGGGWRRVLSDSRFWTRDSLTGAILIREISSGRSIAGRGAPSTDDKSKPRWRHLDSGDIADGAILIREILRLAGRGTQPEQAEDLSSRIWIQLRRDGPVARPASSLCSERDPRPSGSNISRIRSPRHRPRNLDSGDIFRDGCGPRSEQQRRDCDADPSRSTAGEPESSTANPHLLRRWSTPCLLSAMSPV